MMINCWSAHHGRWSEPAVARIVTETWGGAKTVPLCRDHLHEALDMADDGVIKEPTGLEWLNGAWH